MEKRFKRQLGGFTLIELLVVVLIIGILSAIALPQYEKAVEKSRAAEAIVTLKALRDAQTACFLERSYGDPACTQGDNDDNNLFDYVDLNIGDQTQMCDYGTTAGPANKNFEYWLDGQYIMAIRRPCDKYTLETTAYQSNYEDQSVNNITCSNDDTKDWCKILGL